MKGKWTKAGVRHRGSREYWVRAIAGKRPRIGSLYRIGGETFLRISSDIYIHGAWGERVADGWRRWSEPIEVPK